jgi:dihydrolipoamide dehydrogenase
MALHETELAVVGAGPGGYAAAFLAADKGMQVTLIDAQPKPGGVCLHTGCIPSKALLHAAHLITQAREGAGWGIRFAAPEIDLATMRSRKDKIVDGFATNLASLCKRRKVTWFSSRARFNDPHTLALDDGTQVRFRTCILAAGSSPTRLPALSLNSPRLLDSTSALKLDTVPASLLVVGGGYIGLELGTVYASLGSKVTVVELTGSLLPGVDADLVKPLHERVKGLFDKIYLNAKVARIAEARDGIRATLEGEEVQEKEQVFERVLVAVGRKPNSGDLGLDKVGVSLDQRGFVTVDQRRRTSVDHIYAIGDLTGEPMLAHKASHEGKLAVQVIAGEAAVWEPLAIPAVVFTDPEIAWCGLTETEAGKQKREVKVARFPWAASGRANTLGRTDGLTKLVVDPASDRLLGVGLAGAGAGELIAEGVLAMEMGATSHDLALCIHPHPTLTETLMEAAESLHGLASHVYKVRK